MSKPLSRKQRQLQDDMAIYATNVVKFVSLLILRNQGWGAARLTRFSKKFDEMVLDINEERLTFSDLAITIQEETGINTKDFIISDK